MGSHEDLGWLRLPRSVAATHLAFVRAALLKFQGVAGADGFLALLHNTECPKRRWGKMSDNQARKLTSPSDMRQIGTECEVLFTARYGCRKLGQRCEERLLSQETHPQPLVVRNETPQDKPVCSVRSQLDRLSPFSFREF